MRKSIMATTEPHLTRTVVMKVINEVKHDNIIFMIWFNTQSCPYLWFDDWFISLILWYVPYPILFTTVTALATSVKKIWSSLCFLSYSSSQMDHHTMLNSGTCAFMNWTHGPIACIYVLYTQSLQIVYVCRSFSYGHFRFQYIIDVEKYEISPHVEKFQIFHTTDV